MGEPRPRFSEEFKSRFEILGRLGQGGMSIVYRARQRDLDREVAIKLLTLPPGTPGSERERLKVEGRALARLVNPNIVRLYDVEFDGELPYLVLELVDGTTLRALMDAQRLDLRRTAEIMRAVASGLGYAHARGIVHRDVKPENVLINREGHARLTDFGLAKAGGGERLTEAGFLMGTPAYMAPEVIRGEDAGPGADVYACGVVLFEAITGHVPFDPDRGVESLTAKVRQRAPDVSKINPAMNRALADLVNRCLDRKPSHRPRNGQELAESIAHVESVGGTGAIRRAARVLRNAPTTLIRAPRRAALATIVGCGVVLALGLWAFRTRDAGRVIPLQSLRITPLPRGCIVRCSTLEPAVLTASVLEGVGNTQVQGIREPGARTDHLLVVEGLASGEHYRIRLEAGGVPVDASPEVTTLPARLLPDALVARAPDIDRAVFPIGGHLPAEVDWRTASSRAPATIHMTRTATGGQRLEVSRRWIGIEGASIETTVATPDGFGQRCTLKVPSLASRIREALDASRFLKWLDSVEAGLSDIVKTGTGSGPGKHGRRGGAEGPDTLSPDAREHDIRMREQASWDRLAAQGPSLPPILRAGDVRHSGLGQALADPALPRATRVEVYEALTEVERIDRVAASYALESPHGLPDLYRGLVRQTSEKASSEDVPPGVRVLLERDKRHDNLHIEGASWDAALMSIRTADRLKELVDAMVAPVEIPAVGKPVILGLDGRTTSQYTYVDLSFSREGSDRTVLRLRVFGEGEGVNGAENPLQLLTGPEKPEAANPLPFQRFWLHLAPGVLPAGRLTMRVTAHPITPSWVWRAPWAMPAIYAVYLLPGP